MMVFTAYDEREALGDLDYNLLFFFFSRNSFQFVPSDAKTKTIMRNFLLLGVFCGLSSLLFAQSTPDFSFDDKEIRFKESQVQVNQQALRALPNWQNFVANHPRWQVQFDEHHRLPHRAFGPGIVISGASVLDQADAFIQNELNIFGIRSEQLSSPRVVEGKKHTRVFYSQEFDGMEVLRSQIQLKFIDQKLVMIQMDYYTDAAVPTGALLSEDALMASAMANLNLNNLQVTVGDRALLPQSNGVENEFLQVKIIEVFGYQNTIPKRYRCLVDELTGELITRENQVYHISPKEEKTILKMGMPVTISGEVIGSVIPDNPYNPAVIEPMSYIDLSINGVPVDLDVDADFVSNIDGPSEYSMSLQGNWSRIVNNGVVPSTTGTLADGYNSIDIDSWTNLKERSAYRGVNLIHDHMKTHLPNFTGLDFSLTTNIDVEGECNAFYDGNSVNFYDAGGGCNSTALIADVIFHEYGHGINDFFYQSLGTFFQNGAMNEGYADFWAMSLSQNNGLLAVGFYDDNQDPLRRYDIDPKVYPDNLIGQVHNDGEIICGAWYDTHLLLGGDWDVSMDLFIDAYSGAQAATFNGNEGVAYSDVLLDALQADDDDGDLTNGTPNDAAIVEGFEIHGITLLSYVDMDHADLQEAPAETVIEIVAEADIVFPATLYFDSITAHYRMLPSNEWLEETMVDNGDGTFSANIDGQPEGTIIAYYLSISDIYGGVSGVLPIGADVEVYPNLPYYVLVNYTPYQVHDADENEDFGDWQEGLPGDLATTGEWDNALPVGSFSEPGDLSTVVAPFEDHTPGNDDEGFCFVTGNSFTPDGGMGENDVDAGHTTLVSPTIDLSDYTDPVFSYWRWYANAPAGGANPSSDWFQVDVSDDGGNSWVSLENTLTQDISWRRNVFRVADYVDLTENFQMRFIASDSLRPGTNLEGGSLVEAALDDIVLYDLLSTNVNEQDKELKASIYPNPGNESLNIRLRTGLHSIVVLDLQGRVVVEKNGAGSKTVKLDTSELPSGTYIIREVGEWVTPWQETWVKR